MMATPKVKERVSQRGRLNVTAAGATHLQLAPSATPHPTHRTTFLQVAGTWCWGSERPEVSNLMKMRATFPAKVRRRPSSPPPRNISVCKHPHSLCNLLRDVQDPQSQGRAPSVHITQTEQMSFLFVSLTELCLKLFCPKGDLGEQHPSPVAPSDGKAGSYSLFETIMRLILEALATNSQYLWPLATCLLMVQELDWTCWSPLHVNPLPGCGFNPPLCSPEECFSIPEFSA